MVEPTLVDAPTERASVDSADVASPSSPGATTTGSAAASFSPSAAASATIPTTTTSDVTGEVTASIEARSGLWLRIESAVGI